MQVIRTRALLAVCSVALSVLVSPAFAKPSHGHRAHYEGHAHVHHAGSHRHASRRHLAHSQILHGRRYRIAQPNVEEATTPGQPLSGLFGAAATSSFGDSSVVSEARRYLGTNPTGRGSLWCGAFMDMVLKRTGHPGGGNLATSYAHYGTRVSGPQVGAIAVMGRGRGGGHVGVVSGVDPSGNPIIISGNHNRRVAESVYPRGRIFAYVMPGA
jgi:uncharacterized protein (TIGR02594 family)